MKKDKGGKRLAENGDCQRMLRLSSAESVMRKGSRREGQQQEEGGGAPPKKKGTTKK